MMLKGYFWSIYYYGFKGKRTKKKKKKKEEHILLTFGKLPTMATHSPRESSEGEIIRERERNCITSTKFISRGLITQKYESYTNTHTK